MTSITVRSRIQDLGYPVSNKKENRQIYSGAKGLNHYFSNEEIHVAKKVCENMLHVSSVREMQITTAMKLSVHLLGVVFVKRTEQVWGVWERRAHVW